MYRQGDVMLVPVSRPYDLRRVPRKKGQGVILAEGEATGHHHRIRSKGVSEWIGQSFGDRGKRYVVVSQLGATVTHEEHDPIEIPAGTYEIVRQKEYTVEDDRRDLSPREAWRRSRNVWD